MHEGQGEDAFTKQFGCDVLGGRHQGDVDEVRTARTAQVRMGETKDAVLVEIIAAAGIPSDVLFGLGTKLNHSLRHCRTRESAAAQGTRIVGLRAYKRIDILCVVCRYAAHGYASGQTNECYAFCVQHIKKVLSLAAKFGNSFVIFKKKTTFVAKKIRKHMKRPLVLLLAVLPFQAFSISPDDSLRVDTLRQVDVQADSVLRVNEAIRQTLEREKSARIGTLSVSDVIGGKATDKILHPFAVKERKREKKHARDRKILKEYEELGRIKTFEELLDEAVRQQAIEDGKEPPTRSGKKK